MNCPNCGRSFRKHGNGLAFHLTWCKAAAPVNTVTLRVDPVTEVRIPVATVLHLTDQAGSVRPAVLGRSDWFADADAVTFAREQSAAHPAPQRFAVFGPDLVCLSIWQAGAELPRFVAEPEPTPDDAPVSSGDTISRRDDDGTPDVAGPALAHEFGDHCTCSDCAGPDPLPALEPARTWSISEPTRPEPVPASTVRLGVVPGPEPFSGFRVLALTPDELAYVEAHEHATYSPLIPNTLKAKFSRYQWPRTLEIAKVRPVFDPLATDPLGPWAGYGPAAPVRDRERVKHSTSGNALRGHGCYCGREHSAPAATLRPLPADPFASRFAGRRESLAA